MTGKNKPGVGTESYTNAAERESFAPLYWVVMHNDPVTTMEFVVDALVRIYGFDLWEAERTMLSIHNNGLERIAQMPLERAEFKVEQTHQQARASGFPLTCTIEPGRD
ncbi:MAG: ATP-dependent Clp protease adaptor ClpS [Candidatus Nitrospinota bacterium M3_3B_026]